MFEDAVAAPAAWLRFWFPDPDGGDTEHQRAYTISESDDTTGHFSADFVLHEPASAWASDVEPGATIEVTSLDSSKFGTPDVIMTDDVLSRVFDTPRARHRRTQRSARGVLLSPECVDNTMLGSPKLARSHPDRRTRT